MKYEKFIREAGLSTDDFRMAWAFANDEIIENPEIADELALLVLAGKKTATASALAGYEENEALPQADGKFELILDGKGEPVAAIQTTKVYIEKFANVSAEHAYKEGEGDRTLEYWRQEHEKFWRQYDLFAPEMDVVCEEFEVLYKK